MKLIERKMITVTIIGDAEHIICGNIDNVIRNLNETKSRYESEYENLKIDIETVYEPYCDDRRTAILKGNRLETQEEYDKRIKTDNDNIERMRRHELAQLKALQEKYKDI